MAEPPSFGLQVAALPLIEISEQFLGLSLALGVGFFGLSLIFSLGYFALETLNLTKQDLPIKRPLTAALSMQSGRVLAFCGVVLGFFAPVMTLLSPISQGIGLMLYTVIIASVYMGIVLQFAKVLAQSYPQVVLRVFRYPLWLWQYVCFPFSFLMLLFIQAFQRRMSGSILENQEETDFKDLYENLHSEEDENKQKLLRNVLEFDHAVANELMVPRPDVVWISIDQKLEEVLRLMSESGHTRFPLCEQTPDKVIGYLHAKDLAFLGQAYLPGQVDLKKLARNVAFVPETAKAASLLEQFQQDSSHMAIVVDEFGGMSGIVTLEDLLEELVGDIRDEFDTEEPEVRTLEGGDLMIDGSMRLAELEEDLGLQFGDVEEETLGGYIFGRLARQVKVGDTLAIPRASLLVEEVDGLRVTQVRISLYATLNVLDTAGEELNAVTMMSQPAISDST